MKLIVCMVLLLVFSPVQSMKLLGLYSGGGSGAWTYQQFIDNASKHASDYHNSFKDVTIRGEIYGMDSYQKLSWGIEAAVNLVDAENVNDRSSRGQTILHLIAQYGTVSQIKSISWHSQLCPFQRNAQKLKASELVYEKNEEKRELILALEEKHETCEYCSEY